MYEKTKAVKDWLYDEKRHAKGTPHALYYIGKDDELMCIEERDLGLTPTTSYDDDGVVCDQCGIKSDTIDEELICVNCRICNSGV